MQDKHASGRRVLFSLTRFISLQFWNRQTIMNLIYIPTSLIQPLQKKVCLILRLTHNIEIINVGKQTDKINTCKYTYPMHPFQAVWL